MTLFKRNDVTPWIENEIALSLAAFAAFQCVKVRVLGCSPEMFKDLKASWVFLVSLNYLWCLWVAHRGLLKEYLGAYNHHYYNFI